MSVPDDICPRPHTPPPTTTHPAAQAIYPASVWHCESPDQVEQLLAGKLAGYAYQRDGHPNADAFAEKCKALHQAEETAVTSSGMSATALALLSQTAQGDHVVVSQQLYGRTTLLLTAEANRLGVASTLADPYDLEAFAAAFTPNTRLAVVETISNPRLRVADIGALAKICQAHGARLMVDNTFATPALCQPLTLGASLVMESVSKLMNGHSDVMLGLLCGHTADWGRVPLVLSAWGLTSPPFDCYLAERGLATLHLRAERAGANALHAARFLSEQPQVAGVDYPGLAGHPDHALATRQFGGRYGSVATFHLAGGRAAVEQFMRQAPGIPFCPSLGEPFTSLSHPASTSHRSMAPQEKAELGISEGTIRLSLGLESPEFVAESLAAGLKGL
ncbi:trans-sulfuration enzyme family protein [Lignipirellula cremea]|uniref:O-succinylhomoserine sulfhydrylase n=1 Tax=Lignipirellula cremea TaxID=2528010 RepID=A0A518DZM2_9BACT|nr:aminotransferase class I/II-fold pyridoxal phosphate-dependent enzyme [Lignipirellula cremea]QDU97265.1 O-succinylhomoserine sulfhydrylase [Lignipirellula cremea]